MYLNHSKGTIQTQEERNKMAPHHPKSFIFISPPLERHARCLGRPEKCKAKRQRRPRRDAIPCVVFPAARGHPACPGGFVECTRNRRSCARAAEIFTNKQTHQTKQEIVRTGEKASPKPLWTLVGFSLTKHKEQKPKQKH